MGADIAASFSASAPPVAGAAHPSYSMVTVGSEAQSIMFQNVSSGVTFEVWARFTGNPGWYRIGQTARFAGTAH